jgi:hypothetical protein
MKLIDQLNIPKEKVIRKKPINLGKKDFKLFSNEIEKILPAVSAKLISKCFIMPNGKLLERLFLNNDQFNISPNYRIRLKTYIYTFFSITQIRKISNFDNMIFITNTNSHNFFHWCLDVLQKLEMIDKKLNNAIKKKYSILIPYGHNSSFIKQTLNIFNLKFYEQDKNELIFLKKIVLLPDISPTGNYRKDLICNLRHRLQKYFSSKLNSFKKKRIFISRSSNKNRKIINENQIYPILIEKGFLILDFDLLSFNEQLGYIINCEILISSHGAGLTHMTWMQERSKVLEIREKDDQQNNCYFTLASDLGHEYHYSFMKKINLTKNSKIILYKVDSINFKKKLLLML